MPDPNDAGQLPRGTARAIWLILAGAWFVCVLICYALLRHFTPLSVPACCILAVPASAALFWLCVQMAEHG